MDAGPAISALHILHEEALPRYDSMETFCSALFTSAERRLLVLATVAQHYSFFRQADGPSHSTSAATTQGLTPCLRSITRSLILPQITVPLV